MGPCLFSMEDMRPEGGWKPRRHCFNGAMLIQHGRRDINHLFRGVTIASMGPCLFSMEDARDVCVSLARQIASMGPCLFSMEDAAQSVDNSGGYPQLQWGHAYSAWKTGLEEGEEYTDPELQWGHAYSAWKT